eukprot:Sspe_Gene.119319::Locus_114907_Transcript_1_1_Confidence_1.000_Length_796::g.119319::m.119319
MLTLWWAACLTLLALPYTTADYTVDALLMYLDATSYTAGAAEWADLSPTKQGPALVQGPAKYYNPTEAVFEFFAPQSELAIIPPTPREMGFVGPEWSMEAFIAPYSPHSGFTSLLSCVKADGSDVFRLHFATDEHGRMFADFVADRFPPTSPAKPGFPRILLGHGEQVHLGVSLRQIKTPCPVGSTTCRPGVDDIKYDVCAFKNGQYVGCRRIASEMHDVDGAFNLQK